MTYAEIKQLALRQLDEDPHDMDEHDNLLSAYVNEGYQTALIDYARPREVYTLKTDEEGNADISGLRILHIAQVVEHPHGYSAYATMDSTGETLHTAVRDGQVKLTALVTYPNMTEGSEEPRIPSWAHAALADYACYRFLSNGNMAKQSRAQFYMQRYLTQMERIRPQAMGHVTGLRNLYAATDVRWVR